MIHSNQEQHTQFEFVSGDLCLDFANSLGGMRGGETREYLNSYNDFVEWSLQAGTITEDIAASLLQAIASHPNEAEKGLERAKQLRENLYTIFAAVASKSPVTEIDLAFLNAMLPKALERSRILPTVDGFKWDWPLEPTTPDELLYPIIRASADLLASPALKMVRECASERCSWLFIDRTKNHRRRWCTMTGCGNVAKVRRHRQRRGTLSR